MLDGQRQQRTTHNTDTYILCVEMVLVFCGFIYAVLFTNVSSAQIENYTFTPFTAEPSSSRVPNHTQLK